MVNRKYDYFTLLLLILFATLCGGIAITTNNSYVSMLGLVLFFIYHFWFVPKEEKERVGVEK